MILEVLDPRGEVRTRLRLESLPLTLGRGYGNDVILDDPYVDASHARIARDEAGTLVVEDLGSVNGLVAGEATVRVPRFAVRPGARLRVGRTTLRFRDTEEPVPPALPEPAGRGAPALPWRDTRGGRLAVSAAAVGAIALYTWLGSYERSGATDAFGGALAFAIFAAAWAGVWAVAGRVVVQRFEFLGHFAVVSAVALASIAYVAVSEWAAFLFPDNAVWPLAEALIGVALVVGLVAAHLALASAMAPRRRLRAGLAVAGVLLAIGAVAALAEDESFSDVPQFSGVLKPLPARWLPTVGVEEFGRTAAELRDEVDALAEEE